jgi:hypothetical protein
MPRRSAWWRGSLALKKGLNLDEPTISLISSTVTCVLPVFAKKEILRSQHPCVCVCVCVCVCAETLRSQHLSSSTSGFRVYSQQSAPLFST